MTQMTATVIKLVRKKGMNTQGGRQNTRQRLGNARKKQIMLACKTWK